MKDKYIRETIQEIISEHIEQGHNISVFDCPNCGHKAAAINVTINTGRILKTHPPMSFNIIEYPEIISCKQCLTCGKKFEKFPPEWKERKE